jgi:hypothetical protein
MRRWASPSLKMVFDCILTATMLYHRNRHQILLREHPLEVSLENSKKLYLLFVGTKIKFRSKQAYSQSHFESL